MLLLQIIALMVCATAAVRGVLVLHRMRRTTPHVRRLAWLCVAAGGALPWVAVAHGDLPPVPLLGLALALLCLGYSVLSACGLRQRGRA